MIPKTYFSTSLSESAKDTESRIRNIFRGQRKRPAVIVLALTAVVAILCGSIIALRSREDVYPLDEAAVLGALAKSGLAGELSPSETESRVPGHHSYVVRGEPLPGHVAPEGDLVEPSGRELVAQISAAAPDGVRELHTAFHRSDAAEPFAWEDWKRQLVFTALLYDGFGEEDVYRVFAGMPVSERESFSRETQLADGFCRVRYSSRTRKEYDENGFELRRCSATLSVDIYESREAYERQLERNGTAPAGEQEVVPSGQTGEQEIKQAAAEASQVRSEVKELPPFVYQGDEPYLPAICDWMTAGHTGYGGGTVTIPCPLIADTDDSDTQDIRVWGDFRDNSYELRGTTLFSVSGGERPGLLHLRRTETGYEVYDAEEVGDGEQYAKDKLRIFGPVRMKKLDALDAEETRTRFVDDYVRRNHLPVTQYQDYGWPPVQLPSAPPTPEAAQIIRHISPAGWSIDYDLREFSYDGYSGTQEGLTGVGDWQGISILIDCDSDTDAGAVISELAEHMEQPIQKDVTIGAAGVPAVMLRDGMTRSEVIKDTYVVALPSGGCLTVTVRNTYYATFGDPIVPGADAVLQKTLATFRLEDVPAA